MNNNNIIIIIVKKLLCQSIIRIVFTSNKYNYLNNDNCIFLGNCSKESNFNISSSLSNNKNYLKIEDNYLDIDEMNNIQRKNSVYNYNKIINSSNINKNNLSKAKSSKINNIIYYDNNEFKSKINEILYNSNKNKSSNVCYEYDFLENLIKKSIEYYYFNHGHKPQLLFRKEEAYDDLIKSIFLTTSHLLFIKVYQNFNNLIINCSKINYIDKEEFINFFNLTLQNLLIYTPNIIKIILSLIHKYVKDIYQMETIEPCLYILFFNFLFNPKVQQNYGLLISNKIVRDLNSLFHKVCYNTKFKKNNFDNYYYNNINPLLNEMNNQLVTCIGSIINLIDKVEKEDKHKLLINDINKKFIYVPNWFFYWDCDVILRVINEMSDCNFININNDVSCSINYENNYNITEKSKK